MDIVEWALVVEAERSLLFSMCRTGWGEGEAAKAAELNGSPFKEIHKESAHACNTRDARGICPLSRCMLRVVSLRFGSYFCN